MVRADVASNLTWSGNDTPSPIETLASASVTRRPPPPPPPSPPCSSTGNVVEQTWDAGGYGGSCTCPDGQVYGAGDNKDSCGSLACVGGTAGTCNYRSGEWSNRKVTCGCESTPPPSASDLPDPPKPVTAQLWLLSSSPGWTCSEPPCAADYEAFGQPDVVLRTEAVEHDFAGQQVQAGLASRWSGRFRAPKTGDCYLTLSTGSPTASAVLLLDRAVAAKTSSAQTVSLRTVSLISNQWHTFELLHHDSANSPAKLSARLHCPGIPGDAFPINAADLSPRRRNRAYNPWPAWPADPANTTAVSRPVDLVAGQRYWMHLECTEVERGSSSCGVGTRIHTSAAPGAAALASAARRWLPRVHRGTDEEQSVRCADIVDKAECCAAIDKDGDVCVPAVTAFANGATCAGWLALQTAGSAATDDVAACPPQRDAATQAARPRTKLARGVACSSLTDRVACCSTTDGRREDATHENAPCVPAVTAFASGAVCESASHIFASEVMLEDLTALPPSPPPYDLSRFGQAQNAASCAELGGEAPLASQFGEEASVMHDVQQVTLSQAAPTRLTQQMTFTVLDCPAMTDCVGGDFQQLQGSVTLQHHGRSSTPLSLKATATEIASAVGGLRDSTYSELVVSSIATTNSTVVWTLELTTPWAACSSQLESRPLFSAQISAKVTVDSVITAGSSCLDGGVDISLSGGDAPPVFLPWDATADAASIVLNTLVQAETDAHGVYVTRAGDGHSTASFTVTFLGGGFRPRLHVVSSAAHPLMKRTYAADYASSSTSADVTLTAERVASGGIELLPIPGRLLSAPTDQPAVRLRLGSQSTARCAAPNWEALHVGCFSTFADGYSYADAFAGAPGSARNFTDGFSLERCAHHCSVAATAAAFAAEVDVCTCLSAQTLASAQDHPAPASNCSATCSYEDAELGSQLCGNAAPFSMASIYRLPVSLSTSGSDLPCSFFFDSGATPTLTAASTAQAATNTSLTLTGTGFAGGSGPPTVEVCNGNVCRVDSHTATSITCTMPDCPDAPSTSPIRACFTVNTRRFPGSPEPAGRGNSSLRLPQSECELLASWWHISGNHDSRS